jgi:hypothetical protein
MVFLPFMAGILYGGLIKGVPFWLPSTLLIINELVSIVFALILTIRNESIVGAFI